MRRYVTSTCAMQGLPLSSRTATPVDTAPDEEMGVQFAGQAEQLPDVAWSDPLKVVQIY